MEQRHSPQSQKPPSGLAGVLNGPEENRDSAYYSNADASSKHNSTASGIAISGLSPTNNGFNASQPDKTPSPIHANTLPQSVISPGSASHMSVASMVSSAGQSSIEARRYDRVPGLENGSNGISLSPGDRDSLSRRESVDSRMNQNFGDLRLGNSPYASHNQSTTSIHSALQHQRNARPGLDTLANHRISNGYAPSAERTPDGHSKTGRTAPAITGPATGHIARAAEPTKGQAWAFPEEEIHRMPSATSLVDSRRSSIADSIASSQYTTESRLPTGQRRLEEGLTSELQRLSSLSGDYPTTHHHALQHRQLGELQGEGLNGQAGSQPYSRTPELRVSHKLAERKRRTEMKELFEQLRDLMPQERGSKASKWEILTKAITEHQRLDENNRNLGHAYNFIINDNQSLRRELQVLQMDNSRLQAELRGYTGAQGAPSVPAQHTGDPYGRTPPRPELPPLRAISGGLVSGPESMAGVQYDQMRSTAFRSAERF